MLRKLFSSGSVSGAGATPHSNSATAAANQFASADAAKSGDGGHVHEDTSGFPQLVSRLEDFEGRLKSTINSLSRHCQAITEVSFSCKSLESGLQDMYGAAVELHLQQEQQQEQDAAASSWIPLIAEFRTSTIAPLQAILAEIPQLKVFCEHRNSALSVKARYDKKIDEIQSTTRYESARLQRNRAKQMAAAVRFKEIDDKVRADIARLLARDLGDLLGDSIEKILMDAQALVAKRLEANARELRERIEAIKVSSAPSNAAALDAKASAQQPEERAQSEPEESDAVSQAPLELAPPAEDLTPAVAAIRIMPQHVLNEDHSVCPRKKHVFGTRTWNLHRHIKDSMATGLDVIECVQLPEGYELAEWVAVHVIDFFNEISLLFGTISEFCTPESCPQMSAGPCYTYLWADGKQQVAPLALTAPAYVDRLLTWVQDQLDDPQVFPLDGAYARHPAFLQHASVVLKRLFRVYAHMYHNHLESFVALHAESHLNFCFKRFVLFVTEFELVDQKELNALRKLIQTLVAPPPSGTSHSVRA